MSIYPKDKELGLIDPDLELDPEALNDDEDLDENELVTPSGDGYYILGNKKNRNFW
jgi:hypothetical protein